MKITKDDIFITSSYKYNYNNFRMCSLTEDIISDDEMHVLGSIMSVNGIKNDEFNMEYVGYFMGLIYHDTDLDKFCEILNEYIDNLK